ncbi:hypothetical protein GGR50DRAFT_103805 [Xylaria sp. CBS 124048]|nr:hypothetical protein GGR50DRAFT_103805 [Xylaria sp. CBS 124048]
MAGGFEVTVPIDIVTRQMPMGYIDSRPASGIELLGIATSTCLLALFLVNMLCTWIRMTWGASSLPSDAGDAPVTMTPNKGSKTARLICQWSTTSLGRLRTGYDSLQNYPKTPTASLGHNTRTKTPRTGGLSIPEHFRTQGRVRAGRKQLLRRPLLVANPSETSTERKDTIFDLEEGRSAFSDGSDSSGCLLLPDEAVTCKESKPSDEAYSGESFLHFRTASLQ